MVTGKEKDNEEEESDETPKEKTGVNITINKTGNDKPDEKEEKKEDPIDRAERINKEKAELLDREEKLQDRKEKMKADDLVSGRAEAGGETPKPKEETDKEYKDRVMSGDLDEGT